MPYIKSGDSRREALQKGEPALNAGELNYQIFYYVKHNYHASNYKHGQIYKFINQFLGKTPNYQKYNDITGVLIRCARELKRRLNLYVETGFTTIMNAYDDEIAKYEDKKIESNGDVE